MNYKDYFYSTFDDDTRLIEAGLKPYIYEYYDDFDDLGYGFDSIDGLCGDSSSGKESIQHTACCFEKDGCVGVIVDDIEVIPPSYDKIRIIPLKSYKKPYFYAIVRLNVDGEKKYGILSDTNDIVLPVIYDEISWWCKWGDFLKDYCFAIKIRQQDKYFCFDVINNAPLFEIDNYDFISEFYSFDWVGREIRDYIGQVGWNNKKYSIVKKGKYYGAIFNDGSIIANPQFKKIKGYEITIQNDKPELRTDIIYEDGVNGWMDYHGLILGLFPNNAFKSIRQLKRDRFIALNNESKYGIIDEERNIVCDFVFDKYNKEYQCFDAGRFVFNTENVFFHNEKGWCIVNTKTGNICTSYYDEIIWHPSFEFCYVRRNGKEGVIRVTGETMIDCIYDKIRRFIPQEGVFALDATLNGVDGSILNGNFVLKKDNDILINHYSHLFPYFPRHANSFVGSHDFYEEKHYSEFSGTYAQDEAGYSDEEIWDIFDGEPDAYWNID